MSGVDAGALAESVRASLATLKDVAGIMGSFVCTPDGRLVSREISAVFDDGALAEAGSRLLRMREAFAAGGDEMEVGVIRFQDHRIYTKTVGNSMLMILTEADVNMPALRMAANLVGRRIRRRSRTWSRSRRRRVRAGAGGARAAAATYGGAPGNAPVPRPRRGLA